MLYDIQFTCPFIFLVLAVLLKEKTMNIIRYIKIQIELRRVERLTSVLKNLSDSHAADYARTATGNVCNCLTNTTANLGLLIKPSSQVRKMAEETPIDN